MPLELSELAGGLPIAASFAMASGINALREGRRRTSLNMAMHELRRPLQGLALLLPAGTASPEQVDSCLRMAIAALEELDREINGEGLAAAAEPVPLRSLVESAMARWRPRAEAAGRSLSLRWKAGDPTLRVDRIGLARALDNLISNAFAHGSGAVDLEAVDDEGVLRLLVRDRGCRDPHRGHRLRRLAGRRGRDRRHGHGLRIVRRLAASCGGSFELRSSPLSTVASLELPLQERRR
jgi:signal transduction histidine kinase